MSTIKIRSIATDKEWNDWHWQLRNRITDVDELRKYINSCRRKKPYLPKKASRSVWQSPPTTSL